MTFRAPIPDILHAVLRIAGRDDDGTMATVLEQAERFAREVLRPLDPLGDRAGVVLDNGVVTTPPGFREAYRLWIEGGWNGLAAPVRYGGQGLGRTLQAACAEIWSAANLSFGLCPLLTASAIEALAAHGSDDVKRVYLPKLVSGEWTGTMNLTEPQAGSDLGALRTGAVGAGDGSYRVTGEKIYITFGEHDLAANIIHLVLARLPGAAPGTRGLSLFLVPKFLPLADGSPGARNDVFCVGIERKLGIHAAPTCTMSFGQNGGATGFLVGEEGRGLNAMFAMMNEARLAVGLQGVGVAERAQAQARRFASDRRQGRAPGDTAGASSRIVAHPDVARMLMTAQALTAAARALCALTAAALDAAEGAADPPARRGAQRRAAFLTPVAKAFATDVANEVASLNIQVHGGLGFIEAAGAAQLSRDARILPIYEGTNGIQAVDLVTRKLPLDDGEAFAPEMIVMRSAVAALRAADRAGFGESAERLGEVLDALERATAFLRARVGDALATVLAGATNYLRLFALARGGVALAAGALAARGAGDDAAERQVIIARFFAEQIAPAGLGLATVVVEGANDVSRWQAASRP